LIAYTRTGDASLNGVVDDDDVTIVNAAYNPTGTEPRWAYGNFDMDGGVADDDVTLLGVFFDPSAQPFATPHAAPVAFMAADHAPARAVVFADLGGARRAGRGLPPDYVAAKSGGGVNISAADLAAIADQIFTEAGNLRKQPKLAI
jgi:hypothetical protein